MELTKAMAFHRKSRDRLCGTSYFETVTMKRRSASNAHTGLVTNAPPLKASPANAVALGCSRIPGCPFQRYSRTFKIDMSVDELVEEFGVNARCI